MSKKQQRADIQDMLANMQGLCKANDLGPGTEEFSLQCTLAALNGNWPRIKNSTWGLTLQRYRKVLAKQRKTPEKKTPVAAPLTGSESVWDLLERQANGEDV